MAAVTMRAAQGGDVEVLARMCRRVLPFDALREAELTWLLWDAPPSGPRCQHHMTVAGATAPPGDWENRRRRLRRFTSQLVAERHGAPVGMAFGSTLRDEDGRQTGNLNLIVVEVHAQRSGVGAALASTLEERWAADGVRQVVVGGAQPRYVWPGVDLRYISGLRFFVGRDYRPVGDAHNMTVRLDDLFFDPRSEALLADRGYVVRRLRHSDRSHFRSWLARWGDGWQEETLSSLRHRPVSCHVALAGERFVGFAAYDTNRGGWFGPMGTVPEARGQGIGEALLRRCLLDHRNQGRVQAEIAWAGPIGFYERTVGARVGRSFRRLKKELT